MTLEAVQEGVARAARRAERDARAVHLVAVSKTHDAPAIKRAALDKGHRLFGENRVQEAAGKWPDLREAYPNVALHLIGPLQTNKVAQAFRLFDAIHSLDRERLAEKIAREAQRQGHCPDLFIEVNSGEERQKSGVFPGEADAFIARCRNVYGLPIAGLMVIPPMDEPPSPHFALLRLIAERNGVNALSMGMSADYETAIALGATHIRVGNAVFGERRGTGEGGVRIRR